MGKYAGQHVFAVAYLATQDRALETVHQLGVSIEVATDPQHAHDLAMPRLEAAFPKVDGWRIRTFLTQIDDATLLDWAKEQPGRPG